MPLPSSAAETSSLDPLRSVSAATAVQPSPMPMEVSAQAPGLSTSIQAWQTGRPTDEQKKRKDDKCEGGPGDPTGPLPEEDGGNREFNTPSLLGVAASPPFFHDGSAQTVLDAVRWYHTFNFFLHSPAGKLLPQPSAFTNLDAEDIAIFLEALSVDPSPVVVPPSSSPLSSEERS